MRRSVAKNCGGGFLFLLKIMIRVEIRWDGAHKFFNKVVVMEKNCLKRWFGKKEMGRRGCEGKSLKSGAKRMEKSRRQ